MTKDKIEAPDAKAEAAAAIEAKLTNAEPSKAKPEPAKAAEPDAPASDSEHERALAACTAAHAEVFPAHEEQPQEGGSWIRKPDGTLVREEEA